MARGKAVTKRGKCLRCGGVVRWKCVPTAEKALRGISPHELWNWNGSDYTTRHSCDGAFGQTQEAQTVEQTGQTETTEEQTEAQTIQTDTAGQTGKQLTQGDLDALLALAVEVASSKVRSEVVAVLDSYGIKQTTEIKVLDAKGNTLSITEGQTIHPVVPKIMQRLARGKAVYAYGPAGSGKTHGACQAVTMLGLEPIVCTMPGITTGKLLGFVDAGGREVQTAFMRAFTEGCVFVADEFDRMIPSVASALNSVLAQRRFTINGRTVDAHPNFGFVATGNTAMRGGTRQYSAAQPIDLATAARFAFLEFTYDDATETSIVSGILGMAKATALLSWIRGVRANLEADQVDTVWAGPREAIEIATALSAGETLRDAVNEWVWRGYPADAVKRYERAHPLPKV